ncbi:unnamed protein product [Microthlaspi erraticum]|uniref:Uncharacterized protein n=1 Tax=Microthlaspi erraticum TaxID=1685480 RepID=A0A6D2IIL4_9BRAS|nr:unnamed protein product [Microthlaspi erraticum]
MVEERFAVRKKGGLRKMIAVEIRRKFPVSALESPKLMIDLYCRHRDSYEATTTVEKEKISRKLEMSFFNGEAMERGGVLGVSVTQFL